METRCARCGAAMSCTPEGHCWCMELPKGAMPAETAGATKAPGCFCRECLQTELERQEVTKQESD